jgi:hypothetical protein
MAGLPRVVSKGQASEEADGLWAENSTSGALVPQDRQAQENLEDPPNFVVSPFAQPHYVDHQNIDTTAILAFVERGFNLQPLTKRDAAQPDISAGRS